MLRCLPSYSDSVKLCKVKILNAEIGNCDAQSLDEGFASPIAIMLPNSFSRHVHLHLLGLLIPSAHQCIAIQCCAVQGCVVQCSVFQDKGVKCRAVQCTALQYSALQYSSLQYSSLQYNSVHCSYK